MPHRRYLALLVLIAAATAHAQSDCTALAAGDVANGGSLTEDTCYEAQVPLRVNEGTLTIPPGVRIEFGANGFFHIRTGGRLNAAGTADRPITLTSIDAAGSWRGIHFDNSRSADNVLHYVTIENAGSAGWSGAGHSQAALQIEGETLVDIRNSTIAGSGGQGVNVYGGSEVVFENNTLTDNAVAAWVHPDAAGYIGSSNTFDGNASNVVRVGFGNNDSVSFAQTWHGGIPFEVQGRIFIRAPLTLEAGTTLALMTDTPVIVVEGGSVTAIGTAESPILLTSVASQTGNWQGLQIQTAAAANRFDYVIFENGGSRAWTGEPDSSAMVYLDGTSRAEITNSVFRGGEGIPGYWLGIEYDTLKGDNVLENVAILDAGSEDFICCGDNAASVLVNGDGFASLANVAFQNTMGHAILVAQGGRLNCTSVEGNGARFKFLTNQGPEVRDGCE